VLTAQWNAADNRQWCSAVFPVDVAGLGEEATIRSANFSGGWAVAWDLESGPGRLPTGEYCADCGRGAYGIAGTGALAVGSEVEGLPSAVVYDDDSRFGYGYEGGAAADSGAPLLAVLLIDGEGCVYNVWSFLGEAHLQTMISELRFVEALRGRPTAWLSQTAPPEVQTVGEPPWASPPLSRSAVPEEAYLEWAGELGAPDTCPLLFFTDLGDAAGATIRRATNEGEMLVAWDLPSGPGHDTTGEPCENCGRGVIGLGTFQGTHRADLPVAYEWTDGSTARTWAQPFSFGIEAFVTVEGFECTYWAWSHLGREHLEFLLSQLRRVEGLP
jgi:hypothetical protein